MGDLTLLAPESIATWFEPLGGDPGAMAVIGESTPIAGDVLARIRGVAASDAVRIHSGHDSLVRDAAVAATMQRDGFDVRAQSSKAVRAGHDKVFARQLLADAGVLLTSWGAGDPPDGDSELLVKSRNSTQSRSIAWAGGRTVIDSGSYWERWVEGAEYSVVGFRESGLLAMLPIVSKGATRRDLLPPWRRTRWVNPEAAIPLSDEMYAAARTAAAALDIWGFFEVEFVVSDGVAVIEVNPRISGTLRLAAMAAGVPIFAPEAFQERGEIIPPTLVGVEIPFEGPAMVAERLIATSRLTCVGDDLSEVVRRIAGAGSEVIDILDSLPIQGIS